THPGTASSSSYGAVTRTSTIGSRTSSGASTSCGIAARPSGVFRRAPWPRTGVPASTAAAPTSRRRGRCKGWSGGRRDGEGRAASLCDIPTVGDRRSTGTGLGGVSQRGPRPRRPRPDVADGRRRPGYGLGGGVPSPDPRPGGGPLPPDGPDRIGGLPLLGDRVCPGAPRRAGGVLGPPDPRHHSEPRAAGAAELHSSTGGGDELGLSEPPDGTDGLSVKSRQLVELGLGARTGRRLGS